LTLTLTLAGHLVNLVSVNRGLEFMYCQITRTMALLKRFS